MFGAKIVRVTNSELNAESTRKDALASLALDHEPYRQIDPYKARNIYRVGPFLFDNVEYFASSITVKEFENGDSEVNIQLREYYKDSFGHKRDRFVPIECDDLNNRMARALAFAVLADNRQSREPTSIEWAFRARNSRGAEDERKKDARRKDDATDRAVEAMEARSERWAAHVASGLSRADFEQEL